jgi:hypothetical protein
MAITTAVFTTATASADKRVHQKQVTVTYDDGVEISRTIHRHIVDPGHSLSNPALHSDTVTMATALHTDAVVAAFIAARPPPRI